MNPRLSRRAVLTGALLLGVTSCTTPRSTPDPTEITTMPQPSTSTPAGSQSVSGGGSGRALLAYFSRAGENYFYGGRRNLEVGNTEVVATMIAELIDCDTHRIEASDPYPDGYDATVQRNVAEQDADARPGIADPLASIKGYRRVLLGSPIWNMRPPMIMSTFAESYDFTASRCIRSSPTPSAASAALHACTAEPAPAQTSAPVWPCGARRSPSTAATSRPGSAAPGLLTN
jgi:hypothetical protein